MFCRSVVGARVELLPVSTRHKYHLAKVYSTLGTWSCSKVLNQVLDHLFNLDYLLYHIGDKFDTSV